MKTINIGNCGICASEIALGCMRINSLSFIKASELVRTAIRQSAVSVTDTLIFPKNTLSKL